MYEKKCVVNTKNTPHTPSSKKDKFEPLPIKRTTITDSNKKRQIVSDKIVDNISKNKNNEISQNQNSDSNKVNIKSPNLLNLTKQNSSGGNYDGISPNPPKYCNSNKITNKYDNKNNNPNSNALSASANKNSSPKKLNRQNISSQDQPTSSYANYQNNTNNYVKQESFKSRVSEENTTNVSTNAKTKINSNSLSKGKTICAI